MTTGADSFSTIESEAACTKAFVKCASLEACMPADFASLELLSPSMIAAFCSDRKALLDF